MSVVCVIQARMGSARLPGKVLADFAGEPMLLFMLRRLRSLEVDRLVVATSDLVDDDPIEQAVAEVGVQVVRGPERDVLARFGSVLEQHPADNLVRLTGDNPFTDPDVVHDVIAAHEATGADYSSNVFPRTFPQGLDVEVIKAGALRVALDDARLPREREHVTPYLYRRPDRFRATNVRSGHLLGQERWTVDVPDDLEFARDIVSRLGSDGAFSWRRILSEVGVQAVREDPLLRPVTKDDRAWLAATVGSGLAGFEHPLRWSPDGEPIDDLAQPIVVAESRGRVAGAFSLTVASAQASLEFFPAGKGMPEGVDTLLQAVIESVAAGYQIDSISAFVPNVTWKHALAHAGFRPRGQGWCWTRP